MNTKDKLISQRPTPAGSDEFANKVNEQQNGHAKNEVKVGKEFESVDEVLDMIGASLYSMAAMLVGEGEESIGLMEAAIARSEVLTGSDAAEAERSTRRALCMAAIELIAERNPGGLAAPKGLQHAQTCIEDDDLDAAGISREELEQMLAGPNRASVRNWIEGLATETRVIFVLRAVAGFTADETVSMLAAHGGRGAEGWNPDAVREIFRQGMCSLASQVIHATTAK